MLKELLVVLGVTIIVVLVIAPVMVEMLIEVSHKKKENRNGL